MGSFGASSFSIHIPPRPGGGGRLANVTGRTSRKEKRNPFAGIEKQNYAEVTKTCMERGILFEDPEFPADYTSLSSGCGNHMIEWRRPSEICNDPKFFVGGASRFDVKQGMLGDCWLLAAISSLTMNQKLLNRVVPPNQHFNINYTGCFRFNLWNQGKWVEVLVDDRLPTQNGRLIYMHSVEENEFWGALLEKVYAKVNGSYESLRGGTTTEAMEDFTGGITEQIDLKSPPNKLFSIMQKAFQRCSMMGCSLDPIPGQIEAKLSNGLICGHAYSITGLTTLDARSGLNTPSVNGKIPMVRVRNPWGESEWNGPWCDKSSEWRFIPDAEKKKIGLTHEEDGEFWMTFQDFCHHFQKLEICNLAPDSLDDEELSQKSKKKWETTIESGSWVPRVNAGGCVNYMNTFWTNPQFRVTLTDVDDDDDDDLCTLIIGLLQKDRRKKRKEGIKNLTIGYMVYKLDANDSGDIKDLNYFRYHGSCDKSPSFINTREICGRHKLPQGKYLIIPSTFEPNNAGDFLLRLFTEKINKTDVVDEPTGIKESEPQAEDDVSNPQFTALKEQENNLRENFMKIAGEDMEIDAYELMDVLNTVFRKDSLLEFRFDGFGIEACRSMVAMHDGDMSGKLGFDEFQTLWKDLFRWKTTFKKFDIDKSGNLNSYELRSALNHSGFKLSNTTFQALVMRYSNKAGFIAFGDFVLCAIRLKSMLASFKNHETKNSGISGFHLDDFIQLSMYS